MTKEQINEKYSREAIGVYPFISKHRLTVLKEGLYTKKNSNYRGISYLFDDFSNSFRSLLFGYYHVKENLIVVPPDLDLTLGKQDLIDEWVMKGFKISYSPPSTSPVEFKEGSVEWNASKKSYEEHKMKANDTFNNKQT